MSFKEKAEKWLWDSCGYAPDDSVDELAGWIEKAEKLEAIKKQLVEFPCIHIQDYQRMMRKIKKILEAEG